MKEIAQDIQLAVRHVETKIADKIADTVFDKTAKQLILSVDEKIRDRVIAWSFGFLLQFGRGHELKTSRAKGWFKAWTDCWYQGEEGPFALYAPGVLEGFRRHHINVDVVKPGPGVFLANHPDGPLQGNWYPFGLDEAIVNQLGGLEFKPRWFHKEFSDDPILNRTSIRIVRDRYSQLLARTCNTLLFGRDHQKNTKMIEEAREHLAKNGLLALCYEGQGSKELTRARSGIGGLLKTVCREMQVPIYPVGAWADGDHLNLAFSEPFSLNDNSTGREIIHFGAVQIARLLPEERRGYYAQAAKLLLDKKE